jgi:hypothetical protein
MDEKPSLRYLREVQLSSLRALLRLRYGRLEKGWILTLPLKAFVCLSVVQA